MQSKSIFDSTFWLKIVSKFENDYENIKDYIVDLFKDGEIKSKDDLKNNLKY